ncbi:DUF4190 domain-containing protein [Nocardia sp. NPDC003693]
MSYEYPPPGNPPPPQPGYYGAPPPDHPQATTVLILGILSLVLCQFLGPVAWVMGKRARDEIDASHGTLGGRGMVNAGYICGIVATCLLALGLLVVVIAIVVGAFSSTTA